MFNRLIRPRSRLLFKSKTRLKVCIYGMNFQTALAKGERSFSPAACRILRKRTAAIACLIMEQLYGAPFVYPNLCNVFLHI